MNYSAITVNNNSSAFDTYLIDDSDYIREVLATALNCEHFRIIFSCADIRSAIFSLQAARNVHLILVSIRSDIDATLSEFRQLRAAAPGARMVALSTDISLPLLRAALRAGADAFLLKNLSAEALMLSLRLVMHGEKVLPTPLADVLARMDLAEPAAVDGSVETRLSKREIEILERLAKGESNKHIASAINITEGTVKVHVTNLLRKIKVQNRTQAALWACEHRLVPRQSCLEPRGVSIAVRNL